MNLDQRTPVPAWVRRTVAYGLAVLVLAAVCWLVFSVLLRLALVSFTLAVALLLTALVAPLASRLRRAGAPAAVAALVAVLLLIAVPVGIGLLLWVRVGQQIQDLQPALTAGIDGIRTWLTTGPLGLDSSQVDSLRDQVVGYIDRAVPSPVAGARTALHVLAALALAVFTVFFFVKDGARMWRWVIERTSRRYRAGVDGAGRQAWNALTGYVVGATVIAVVDAVLIGAGLFFVGVPLWLSLTLLTFVGAFVPILGATVSGAVAVLVTLVTDGSGDALIILAVVLVVQQVEGNLLQPLVMGRAVHLHPVVTLVAVTCGTLLLGISGAVVAVPLVAVAYSVAEYLRTSRPDGGSPPAGHGDPGASRADPAAGDSAAGDPDPGAEATTRDRRST